MSIGKTLAEARRKAGLTVEQVSNATRVRQTIIREIEEDNFQHCGGDFYARGHIRGIAHVIGIDPAPLLKEFDQQHNPAVTAPTATEVFEPDSVRPERRGPNWSAAMIAALVILMIFGITQLFVGSPAEPPPTARDMGKPPATSAPPTPRATTASPAPSGGGQAVAQIPRDQVTVRVQAADGSSWMRVTNSRGEQLFEGTFAQGSTQDFVDKQRVKLIVGNAAAVRLVVNGHDLGKPGSQGEVMRVDFGPGDPKQAG